LGVQILVKKDAPRIGWGEIIKLAYEGHEEERRGAFPKRKIVTPSKGDKKSIMSIEKTAS